ncbi:ATP-binding protein [Anaeromyxobacter diazotrophicus]|uniref:histidine kinase n=1 Tax=Anaeromyxobacter diazotrophicus TaxID=2590199 RepID=A0A7I9VT50_9BACT|nr:ATP-binding protein [Anaeromyxobacter diazotrophicus]GEJ59117.1 hypothetical protein AMYX_38580 [Anaeromyxobacter diazotrophicus]
MTDGAAAGRCTPAQDDPVERTSILGRVRPRTQPEQPGLLLVSAPAPGLVGAYFGLELAEVVIGRGGGAEIRVDDPGVSREHLKIRRAPSGEFFAEDLGSTNGTWLNGVAIRSAALAEGDRLQIGTSTEFLFGANRGAVQAEVRLRQAISAPGAGTWEWFVAGGALQLYGGVARAVGQDGDRTEPRADDSWARVHPDDRAALRARLEAAAGQGGAFEAEVRLVRQDGSVCRVAMSGEPFRDRGGRPVRLAGALLDVTERRLADGELRRQSLLFDSLADAVVIVGAGGTILDWSASAERLLGWSKAEVLGRRPGALLLRSGEERLDRVLVECARRGGRHCEELALRAKSGAEVQAELVTVPLVGREEEIVACVAVFRDLGERRRLQARLQIAERLASLGTLAAGVAHEINNPLAFVTSNLDYVSRQLAAVGEALGPERAEIAEALADSRRGAERIASIVRDLQAFGGKERPANAEQADPNAALEFALRMSDSLIRHRARLVKDLRPVPCVRGEEARLGQVFLNLLVNAAHAIEPGRADASLIRVSTRFDDAARRVVIEVADEGAGIHPEVLPRIFEPFFTTKPVGAGTGLGLFVCQGIVTELGGELAVESELGQGTTFRVLLPAAGAAPRVAPASRRVLVVDDEPLLGSALKRCFSGKYDVEAVADPREALIRLRGGERFLFALVDLQMPEMTGQDFLASLREIEPELARHAAVITGGSLEEAASRFPAGERPPLLAKPIDLARLSALIDAAADEARA